MKTWTVIAFGREILKIKQTEEASVADVVRHLVAQRMNQNDDETEYEYEYEEIVEGLIPCESCGEMFDPEDVDMTEEDEEVNARFADMTERLIWGEPVAETDEDEDNEE